MSTERQTREGVDVDDDAAVNSQRDLVSKQGKIDALELLGATYVNDKEDLVEAHTRQPNFYNEGFPISFIDIEDDIFLIFCPGINLC